MKHLIDQDVTPDFSRAMTQHVWTYIGKDPATRTSNHVATVYRPGAGVEVWGPAIFPDTSLQMN